MRSLRTTYSLSFCYLRLTFIAVQMFTTLSGRQKLPVSLQQSRGSMPSSVAVALAQRFSAPGSRHKTGHRLVFCASPQFYYSFSHKFDEVLLTLSTLWYNFLSDARSLVRAKCNKPAEDSRTAVTTQLKLVFHFGGFLGSCVSSSYCISILITAFSFQASVKHLSMKFRTETNPGLHGHTETREPC